MHRTISAESHKKGNGTLHHSNPMYGTTEHVIEAEEFVANRENNHWNALTGDWLWNSDFLHFVAETQSARQWNMKTLFVLSSKKNEVNHDLHPISDSLRSSFNASVLMRVAGNDIEEVSSVRFWLLETVWKTDASDPCLHRLRLPFQSLFLAELAYLDLNSWTRLKVREHEPHFITELLNSPIPISKYRKSNDESLRLHAEKSLSIV